MSSAVTRTPAVSLGLISLFVALWVQYFFNPGSYFIGSGSPLSTLCIWLCAVTIITSFYLHEQRAMLYAIVVIVLISAELKAITVVLLMILASIVDLWLINPGIIVDWIIHFVHFLIIVAPPIPLLILALWSQEQAEATTLLHSGARYTTLNDIFFRPWLVTSTVLTAQNYAILVLVCVYTFFGLLDCIWYYLSGGVLKVNS